MAKSNDFYGKFTRDFLPPKPLVPRGRFGILLVNLWRGMEVGQANVPQPERSGVHVRSMECNIYVLKKQKHHI